MKAFKIAFHWFEEATVYVGVASVLVVTLGTFIDVVARFIFNHAYFWMNQLLVWAMIWGVFLMAGLLLKEGGHVSVDIVTNKLRGVSRRALLTINWLATLLFCGLVTWSAVVYIDYLIGHHTTRLLHTHIPFWPVNLCTLIGFGAATLYCIGMLVRVYRTPAEPEQEHTLEQEGSLSGE